MEALRCEIRVPCTICDSDADRELCRVEGYRIAKCSRCGFIFVNPRPSRLGLANLYRHHETNRYFSKDYEPLELESPVLTMVMLTIRRYVRSGNLLEIGCGRGDLLQMARAQGFTATGCDFFGNRMPVSSSMAFFDGPLHDAKFADATFDVVIIRNVLEHLFDPRSELEEVRRVLRPGGYLYTKVPNAQSGRGPFYRRFMGKPYPFAPPYHLSHFGPRALKTLLGGTGFAFVGWTVEQPTLARNRLTNFVRQTAYHCLNALRIMSGDRFPQMTLASVARKPPTD